MNNSSIRKLIYHAVFIILDTIFICIFVRLLSSKNIPMILIVVGSIIIGGVCGYCYAIYKNRKLRQDLDYIFNNIKDMDDIARKKK